MNAAGAEATAAAPPQRGPGLLTVSSRIPVDIYTRGRKIGASNSGEIVLASGTHRIELVNRRFNYRDEVSLEVAPGELTSYSVSLPYGSVRIETSPGAEIWIEGERVGEAPLSDVPVAIGTREVVVRHADRRERRQPVEVRRGRGHDRRCGLRAFRQCRGCGGRNADARGSQPPHHQIGATASNPLCLLRLACGAASREKSAAHGCAVEWEAERAGRDPEETGHYGTGSMVSTTSSTWTNERASARSRSRENGLLTCLLGSTIEASFRRAGATGAAVVWLVRGNVITGRSGCAARAVLVRVRGSIDQARTQAAAKARVATTAPMRAA